MKYFTRLLTALAIIFTINITAFAKELCDYLDTCVTLYPRDVNSITKQEIKLRDKFPANIRAEIDHKIPLCLGGSNDPSNLQALTKEQHAQKTKNDLLNLYYVENGLMTLDEAQQSSLNFFKNNTVKF